MAHTHLSSFIIISLLFSNVKEKPQNILKYFAVYITSFVYCAFSLLWNFAKIPLKGKATTIPSTIRPAQ
ncbi:MAG: hypothetical protein IJF27_06905, partial [Oscillospiraceae bacterium]|nr:hypothetical protein [Oscillospiraceae bacterium]